MPAKKSSLRTGAALPVEPADDEDERPARAKAPGRRPRERSRECEMDELPRRLDRPRQWRRAGGKGAGPESTYCARAVLVLVNAAFLVFGALILFFGVRAFVSLKAEEEIHGLHRPFAVVMAGGAAIVVFSLFGLVGACCAFSRDHGWDVACCSNRLLMGYYVAVLLLCACLFYASLLCFLFVDKAKEYLESYWTLISDIYQNEGLELSEVDELVNKYSSAAGGLCIGAIVLNLICAHLSAKVMGYRYTTRRTIMIINLTGFILAVGLLVLAFVPATQEVGVRNGWLPQFVGGLGVFIAVMSLVGFSGAYWDSIGVLAVNGSIQGLLGLIVLIFGALCLSDAKNSGQMLQPVWGLVKERFVDVCPECDLMGAPESPAGETASNGTTTVVVDGERDAAACCADRAALLVWNNLTVLGVALSTILICILVNALSSLYLYRILRRDRMSPLDDEEMEGLRSKRRAFSRMDRRARDDC